MASTIWSPTVITGFRLVARLLEDHADAPAAHRRICARQVQHVLPVQFHDPPAGDAPLSGSRRISASAVMLLPQPDSPTSAKVSPRWIVRRRPSTGAHQAGGRLSRPPT
jgi:hypothetical protein